MADIETSGESASKPSEELEQGYRPRMKSSGQGEGETDGTGPASRPVVTSTREEPREAHHEAHREARLDWRRKFPFDHVKVLIVCRGPIRLEAIQVFEKLGTQPCGILLSEKDSVVYPRALSPELRLVGRNERVHRLPDYAGASAEEKVTRIRNIISIAREHGYTHLFAGYGFMAEDYEFIRAIEESGLGFIGPSTKVVEKAGAKDAAKLLARSLGVSVTPGIDNMESRALLAKAQNGETPGSFLLALARRHDLKLSQDFNSLDADRQAEQVLAAAREKSLELVTLADLQAGAAAQVASMLAENPGKRLRLKHIGGGGGKGQRIISSSAAVPDAVLEVLNEAKATGPGANRNFLIELNIETTRHNEIQLLGNGKWCIALGGRDCSLQMHEQKLLEVSITDTMLSETAQAYINKGKTRQAEVLRTDLRVLREMEEQAEKFGEAVELDSASTFESIVDGESHYFMEMNTRIQVEHRVTEMVYSLQFTNPDNPREVLEVESLVEAMAWMAVYGKSLPRPERVPRYGSGVEVRINATNDALKPHAGGVVLNWSQPRDGELRDDQGIGLRNPDTGIFMPYNLAGAYDSNVALLVAHGLDRETTFLRLVEIMRCMDLRGDELMTNRGFHYGLLHWMLGADAMVKPTTRFVSAYLAAAGSLRNASKDIDLNMAWDLLISREHAHSPESREIMEAKRTLVLRPLTSLYSCPHYMAGWLSPRAQRRFVMDKGRVEWRQNPLEVLDQLYHYLRLEPHPGVSPEEQIWEHDLQLLKAGLAFYNDVNVRLGRGRIPWSEMKALLENPEPPPGLENLPWKDIQAAHRGHQLGLALLEIPLHTGNKAGFYDIVVNDRLEVEMPAQFENQETASQLRNALEEAPTAHSNQVVAFTGGTFYSRPSPNDPPYVTEGQHVEEGQVLGLLEVMKMFNQVRANFSGTVTQLVVHGETGRIVQKGQILLEMEPDVPITVESESERRERMESKTRELVGFLTRVGGA
ncbi:MAG: biotin carboxylase [Deltaproteobacteria bacterium]|nr:biotin carboxylase [Deltaproteobacteria bacterium]